VVSFIPWSPLFTPKELPVHIELEPEWGSVSIWASGRRKNLFPRWDSEAVSSSTKLVTKPTTIPRIMKVVMMTMMMMIIIIIIIIVFPVHVTKAFGEWRYSSAHS
jgi:hypothetical protein